MSLILIASIISVLIIQIQCQGTEDQLNTCSKPITRKCMGVCGQKLGLNSQQVNNLINQCMGDMISTIQDSQDEYADCMKDKGYKTCTRVSDYFQKNAERILVKRQLSGNIANKGKACLKKCLKKEFKICERQHKCEKPKGQRLTDRDACLNKSVAQASRNVDRSQLITCIFGVIG